MYNNTIADEQRVQTWIRFKQVDKMITIKINAQLMIMQHNNQPSILPRFANRTIHDVVVLNVPQYNCLVGGG
jgi:hypothetical protein